MPWVRAWVHMWFTDGRADIRQLPSVRISNTPARTLHTVEAPKQVRQLRHWEEDTQHARGKRRGGGGEEAWAGEGGGPPGCRLRASKRGTHVSSIDASASPHQHSQQ
jgi:hypothetical protein